MKKKKEKCICIFEFMVNTAPLASNSVFGREKLFWYEKINFSYHLCHCGAVVKQLLERANKPGSTPGDAVFFFLCTVFFLFGLFFLILFFPFGLFFFIVTANPAGHALGSIYILTLCPGFILEKGFQKLLIYVLANLTTRKNHKLSRHVPPLKQVNFFQYWLTSWQTTHSTPQNYKCMPNTVLKCGKATRFNAQSVSQIPVI